MPTESREIPTVYIKTLGCKVNSFDSSALAHQFTRSGYNVVTTPKQASISIINSCSVTANADKEARYLARRFKRQNTATFVVVTGCYAQTHSENLLSETDIDYIVPNEAKHQLVELVQGYTKPTLGISESACLGSHKLPMGLSPVRNNRQKHFKSSVTLFDHADTQEKTRAFLKIQDGCNGFCTYCLIPLARGASRSIPSQDVLEEVRRLVAQDIPEIVLTGIHIGDYGLDFTVSQDGNLEAERYGSLESLLGKIENLCQKGTRLRISSLEPNEASDELLQLMAAKPLIYAPHLHLPLQAGCDRILKMMARKYTCAEYYKRVCAARTFLDDPNIGADVITGFPGETEEDFSETLAFIEHCDLNYLHVFPYSKRPGTVAARLPDHLSSDVVAIRRRKLAQVSAERKKNYWRKYVGKTLPLIWERKLDSKGYLTGLSPNYLTIKVRPASTSMPIPPHGTPVLVKGFLTDEAMLGVVQS